MKKSERDVYYKLSKIRIAWPTTNHGEVDWDKSSLCIMCRYARWLGGGCCDSELDCQHGLELIKESSQDVWGGNDCWGFRPETTLDKIVEWISHRMQGEMVGMEER